MFNSIQNISAYATIVPSPEVITLKFQTTFYQNLFVLTIIFERKETDIFNVVTKSSLLFYSKKIDNKIIIVINTDSLKNNLKLFINFSYELSLISGIKIWGDYKREIFDKENSNALFYKISQQDFPAAKSSVAFSETLYSYLKRLCLFEKCICEGNKYYIPKFKENIQNKCFFGRENELKILIKNYNRIKYEYSEESYNIVTIKGVPGIGKTSLVKTFLKERGFQNSFLIANPNTTQPYGYFLEFTNKLFGKTPDFKSAIKSFASLVEDSKLRKNLIDSIPHFPQNFSKDTFLNGNEEKSQNTILSFRNLILAYAYKCASQKRPLILAFDDIQWADVPSVKTINFILDDFRNNFERNLPVQFIFIYRTGYAIGVKSDAENTTEIVVDTLDSSASHNCLQELLKINDLNLSKKIQSSVLVKSGGNPLFLEEIVEHIKYKSNEIPASVKEIIKQRFFSLPERYANFLKVCSVIGKEIDLRMANQLLQRFNSEEISENDLEYLVQNKFLNKTPYLIEFKHDLIKESIYDSLEKSEKKILHDFTGFSIEKIYSEKIENYYYQLAEHFIQAENKEKMIEYLEKAGDRARDEWDIEGARGYYERLVKLDVANSWKENSINLKIAGLLRILGEYDLSEKILHKCIKFFKDGDFKEELCECIIILSDIFYYRANYKKAIKLLLEIHIKFLPIELVVKVYSNICKVYLKMTDYDSVVRFSDLFLQISEANKYSAGIERANNFKGMVCRYKGDFINARKYFERNLEMSLLLKNKVDAANTLSKIGSTYFYTNELSQALKYFKKGYSLNKEVSNFSGTLSCLSNMGSIYLVKKNYNKALNIFSFLEKSYIKSKNTMGLSIVYGLKGNVLTYMRNFLHAEACLLKKLEIDKKTKNYVGLSNCLTNLGILNIKLKKYETALNFFKKQLSMDKKLRNQEGIIRGEKNIKILQKEKIFSENLNY